MMKISLRHMGLAAVASGALALTLAAPAFASTQSSSGYHFRTLNDQRDVTFNQLLGINNEGVIAGCSPSRRAGLPNEPRGSPCCSEVNPGVHLVRAARRGGGGTHQGPFG
jgi:hypothetical protein